MAKRHCQVYVTALSEGFGFQLGGVLGCGNRQVLNESKVPDRLHQQAPPERADASHHQLLVDIAQLRDVPASSAGHEQAVGIPAARLADVRTTSALLS